MFTADPAYRETPYAPARPPRDREVLEWAESRLRRNPYVALKCIDCAYDQGVLTLHGCLPTYYLKQMAQTAVAGLPGVDRVVNQIEVVSPNPRGPVPLH